MKCQNCGKNQATTHIKRIVNGQAAEAFLCSECAAASGISGINIFDEVHNEFENLIGSFFSNVLPARSESTRCKSCGSTYAEIASTGKAGCADCYTEFYDKLLPSIRKLHGNTTHCGKRAYNAGADSKSDNNTGGKENVEELQAQLDEAVRVQDFEKAAQLRDKIKELNSGN